MELNFNKELMSKEELLELYNKVILNLVIEKDKLEKLYLSNYLQKEKFLVSEKIKQLKRNEKFLREYIIKNYKVDPGSLITL